MKLKDVTFTELIQGQNYLTKQIKEVTLKSVVDNLTKLKTKIDIEIEVRRKDVEQESVFNYMYTPYINDIDTPVANTLLDNYGEFTNVWDLMPDGELELKYYEKLSKIGEEFCEGGQTYITGFKGIVTWVGHTGTIYEIPFIMIGVGYPTASAYQEVYAKASDHTKLIEILNR